MKFQMPSLSDITSLGYRDQIGVLGASLLGVSLTLGGHVMYWNEGLSVGVGEFLLCILILATAYLCLCSALAEMTSALPFGGGLYGFIRATLGPYLGFVMGCCEMYQNCVNACFSIFPAGKFITDILQLPRGYDSIFWILIIAIILAINLMGKKAFWRSNALLVLASFALILLYYAITLPCIDCVSNGHYGFADSNPSQEAGNWFKSLTSAWWFFAGMEMLPMACSDAKEPKATIPKALLLSVAIVSVNAVLLTVFIGCTSPGTVEQSTSSYPPMMYSFVSHLRISEAVAKALSVPALVGSASACLFVYGRQLRSMAESGLFPAYLKRSFSIDRTPYAALIHGACLMFLVVALSGWASYAVTLVAMGVGSFANSIVDIAILMAYLVFKRKYANLPTLVHNPFGKVGTLYASLVMLLVSVAVTVLFAGAWISVLLIILYIFLTTCYYVIRVRPSQGFSDEEQKIMFVAYVINANRRTKVKQRRGSHSERSVSISHSVLSSPKNSSAHESNSGASFRSFGRRHFRSTPGTKDDATQISVISPRASSSETATVAAVGSSLPSTENVHAKAPLSGSSSYSPSSVASKRNVTGVLGIFSAALATDPSVAMLHSPSDASSVDHGSSDASSAVVSEKAGRRTKKVLPLTNTRTHPAIVEAVSSDEVTAFDYPAVLPDEHRGRDLCPNEERGLPHGLLQSHASIPVILSRQTTGADWTEIPLSENDDDGRERPGAQNGTSRVSRATSESRSTRGERFGEEKSNQERSGREEAKRKDDRDLEHCGHRLLMGLDREAEGESPASTPEARSPTNSSSSPALRLKPTRRSRSNSMQRHRVHPSLVTDLVDADCPLPSGGVLSSTSSVSEATDRWHASAVNSTAASLDVTVASTAAAAAAASCPSSINSSAHDPLRYSRRSLDSVATITRPMPSPRRSFTSSCGELEESQSVHAHKAQIQSPSASSILASSAGQPIFHAPSLRRIGRDSALLTSLRWRQSVKDMVSDGMNVLSLMVPEFFVKDETFEVKTRELVDTVIEQFPEKRLEIARIDLPNEEKAEEGEETEAERPIRG